MPIRNYGALKGRPVLGELRSLDQKEPHFIIKLAAGEASYEVAVNVESTDHSEVRYHVEHDFSPPNPDGLLALPMGFTSLIRTVNGSPHPLALDFIREGLVHEEQMQLLAIGARRSQNDLASEVEDLTERIDASPDATLFAFGSGYQAGIHDIHMNQGNPSGSFRGDNGIYQDGGIFVYLPEQKRWLAVFIAFQTQDWQTDERGNPISTSDTHAQGPSSNGNGSKANALPSEPVRHGGRHRRGHR